MEKIIGKLLKKEKKEKKIKEVINEKQTLKKEKHKDKQKFVITFERNPSAISL